MKQAEEENEMITFHYPLIYILACSIRGCQVPERPGESLFCFPEINLANVQSDFVLC